MSLTGQEGERACADALHELSAMTDRLIAASNDVHAWEAQASFAVAGSPSGDGDALIACGGNARMAISRASEALHRCAEELRSLVMDEGAVW